MLGVGPSLVGRDDELATLVRQRTIVSHQEAAFVLISGEAGVGKSRLLREFSATLTKRTQHLGRGQCFEFTARPFGALADALATIAPEVSDRLTLAGAALAESGAARAETFAYVQSRLEEIASRRNTTVLLEDLHWADDATFDLLEHLAASVRRCRLLIVGTYRTDAADSSGTVLGFVGRLARLSSVLRIDLKPLREDDARKVAAHAMGSRALPPEVISAIVERGDGNPFFLEELVKHACDEAGDGWRERLPASIRGLIGERFARLAPSDRVVLTNAAVLGREFELSLLAGIIEEPRDRILGALRRARDENFIVEDPRAREPRFLFRHALTQEAILERMLDAERRPLHARIVAALEQATHDDPSRLTQLAYHSSEAGDHTKAIYYNEEAGDFASSVHAYTDATRYYERAMHAAPERSHVRARLCKKMGRTLHHSGFATRASSSYETAIALTAGTANEDDLALLYLEVAKAQYMTVGVARAIESAEKAANLLVPHPESKSRDFALVTLANYYGWNCNAARALEMLSEVGDPDAPGVAPLYKNSQAFVCAMLGDIEGWRAESEALLAIAENHPDPDTSSRFFHNVADTAVQLGFGEMASDAYERSLAITRRHKLPGATSAYAGGYAYQKFLAGDLQGARNLAESALLIAHDWSSGPIAYAPAGLLSALALDDGDLLARLMRDDFVEMAFAGGFAGSAALAGPYALALVECGEHAAARQLLRRILDELSIPYGAVHTLLAAAAHAADRDVERARALVALGDRRHPDVPVQRALGPMFEAIVHARRGRLEMAAAPAAAAALRFREMGWRTLEAQALELAGDRNAAAKLFQANGDVRALRRLARDGWRPDAPGRTGPLSRRESEVARLVARGLSNRDAAAELGIAQKTLEKHLASVFVKLEVASRAQLSSLFANPTPRSVAAGSPETACLTP